MKNQCLISFLSGAVAGAAIAVFTAPMSGKEMRIRISHRIRHDERRFKDALGHMGQEYCDKFHPCNCPDNQE